MIRFIPFIGLVVLFSIAGCGGTSGTGSTTQPSVSTGGMRLSACGAQSRFEFKLHGIDCELANTLVAMLDGRALHQTVALTVEGKRRAVWVCTWAVGFQTTVPISDRLAPLRFGSA